MKSGNYRHRITIEQLTSTPNGEATDEAWSAYASDVPARSRPLTGREIAVAGTEASGTLRAFDIRYGNSVGVTAAMRISHEGTFYNIKSVAPDETLRDQVVIIAEAGIRG